MSRTFRLTSGVVLLSFLGPAPAQEEAAPTPDGPFLWAYGSDNLRDVPYVAALGLNTLFLEMKSPADAVEMSRARVTIQEAHGQGLGVIVGLPLTLPEQHRASLDNPAYVAAVVDYVVRVVGGLRDEPGVIGWATGDHLERHLSLSDSGFQAYLLTKYGSVEGIQQAWGVDVRSLLGITLEKTPLLDDDLPFKAGMPSVDLADYSAGSYRRIMEFWADVVRDASGGHGLLFTGRVALYRSLVSIPDAYDVIVTVMPPQLLEPDWQTHNVHQLDIARRGGRRRAMPCLRLPHPLNDAEHFSARRLEEWMMQAALHGATGVCFEGTPETLADFRVQEQWSEGLEWVGEQGVWGTKPKGAAAIIYEPYADGFISLNVPVYGYIKNMSPREPSDLMNAFRLGTRYGLVEYLTRDDLANADLEEYSFVAAPMALDLPDAAQLQLTQYVAGGGVLVADLGAGYVQSGSWQRLPPGLAGLFGVEGFGEMKALAGNLTIHQAHPVLPSLRSGAQTTGDFETGTHGRRTGVGDYAVNSWAGFTPLHHGTVPLARLSMSVTDKGQPTFAGVLARDTGTGTALFATHRLWTAWMPGHGLWEAFHGELFQRRAQVELLNAPFMAPAVQIVGCEDGAAVLYNAGKGRRVQAALFEGEHRLLSGGVCQFSARFVDGSGLRTGGVLATVDLPQHGAVALAPTPILIKPYSGASTALLERYTAQSVRLLLSGDDSTPTGDYGAARPSAGAAQRIRLTLGSGEYEVAPRSRHRVTVANVGAERESRIVRADGAGRIVAELSVATARVGISPVEDE